MNREAITVALFDKIKDLVTFKTSGRKLKHWNDVSASDQPAMFLTSKGENASPQTNMRTKWTLNFDVYVYANTADTSQVPTEITNPILDVLQAAFNPTDGMDTEKLGGLVHYCRISGSIETDEGLLGDQAVLIIPIEVLVS